MLFTFFTVYLCFLFQCFSNCDVSESAERHMIWYPSGQCSMCKCPEKMIKELTRPLLILVLTALCNGKGRARHLSMTIPFVNYPTTSQGSPSYNLRKSYSWALKEGTTEDFEIIQYLTYFVWKATILQKLPIYIKPVSKTYFCEPRLMYIFETAFDKHFAF